MHFIAELSSSSSSDNWPIIGAISALVALGISSITFIRMATGKGNERQIEPTSLHAITNELRAQTATLNKLDRESGVTLAMVARVEKDITDIKATHRADIEGVHARVGGISRELSATTARVNDLKQEKKT